MIIYLDNHAFPPSPEAKAAAGGAGAAVIYSTPWPAAVADLGAGAHDVAAPAPPRRLIAKSVIQERVNTLGKWGAVVALMFTAGLPNIYFGRWFAPNWGEVYADDTDMLTLLAAGGCTEQEIAQVTA